MSNYSKDIMLRFLEGLRSDKIVVAQADTIVGLFGKLSQVAKIDLDRIKQRKGKPYIVLLPSYDVIFEFIDQPLTCQMDDLLQKYWPGPLTVIFKAKSNLPDWLRAENNTIALRVPNHDGLQEILMQERALFSTSANISDRPVPERYQDIAPEILAQVVNAVDPDAIHSGLASTILDFSLGSIKMLRLGAVAVDSI